MCTHTTLNALCLLAGIPMGRGRTVNPALARAFKRAANAGHANIDAEWKRAKRPGTLANAARGYKTYLPHCLLPDDYAKSADAEPGSWVLLAAPTGRSGRGKAKAGAAAQPSKRKRLTAPSAAELVASLSEAEKEAMRRALGM